MKWITVLFMLAAGMSAQAQQKFAVVDTQKALFSTSAGKKFKESMDKEVEKRKKELDKRKADFEKMAQDFDKKRSVLSEEVQQRKASELQEEQLKVQKFFAENQLELQKKEKELVEPLIERMRKVIERVSRSKGYTVVLEKNGQGVLFAEKEVDLTDEVVSEFEKEK